MNSTIYYVPEAKAQPNFHQNQPNYQQGYNQPGSYQNQPNYGQNQSVFQQNQSQYYQNQNQPNPQQYQQNYPQQQNYQQSQCNYQPNQSHFYTNQSSFQQSQSLPQQSQANTQPNYNGQQSLYQNQQSYGQPQPNYYQAQPHSQPKPEESQLNFHAYQQNYAQNQPDEIQQSSTPFMPAGSNNHYQQPDPQQVQQAKPQQVNYDQNQSKYPQLEPNNHFQENNNIILKSFVPPPKTNLQPSQMQLKANKFGIAIDIIGENQREESSIKYTLYNIQGYSALRGSFSAVKGYEDFCQIHRTLINKFPGASQYLHLPDRTLFLKSDDSTTQAKRDGLAKFLKLVACSTEFFFDHDFQRFLATGPLHPKEQVRYLNQQNSLAINNNPHSKGEYVEITIVSQFEKHDVLTSHTEYFILGKDSKGEFRVNRRYSDFVMIREILKGKFPKIPFVHLPGTTSSGAGRLNGLIAFLKSIPRVPAAYHSLEWQIFIRYEENDVQQKLKPFKTSTSILETLF